MKEQVYKCSECGSTDIEFRRWYNPNTGEIGVDCEDEECWCKHCEEHCSVDCVEVEMPDGLSETEIEERYNDFVSRDNYERLDCFVEFVKEVLQPILDHEKADDNSCYDFEEEIHSRLRDLVVELGLKYREKIL